MNTQQDIDPAVMELVRQAVNVIKAHVIEKPMCVKEAAAFLGVHANTIYSYIKDGMPFYQKRGRAMFLYASEINNWIKS